MEIIPGEQAHGHEEVQRQEEHVVTNVFKKLSQSMKTLPSVKE